MFTVQRARRTSYGPANMRVILRNNGTGYPIFGTRATAVQMFSLLLNALELRWCRNDITATVAFDHVSATATDMMYIFTTALYSVEYTFPGLY